jgi:hypothetical protein
MPLLFNGVNFNVNSHWNMTMIRFEACNAIMTLILFGWAGFFLAKKHDLLIFVAGTEIYKVTFVLFCHR